MTLSISSWHLIMSGRPKVRISAAIAFAMCVLALSFSSILLAIFSMATILLDNRSARFSFSELLVDCGAEQLAK